MVPGWKSTFYKLSGRRSKERTLEKGLAEHKPSRERRKRTRETDKKQGH